MEMDDDQYYDPDEVADMSKWNFDDELMLNRGYQRRQFYTNESKNDRSIRKFTTCSLFLNFIAYVIYKIILILKSAYYVLDDIQHKD